MIISMICPYCKGVVCAADHMAGRVCRCNHCGNMIIVPHIVSSASEVQQTEAGIRGLEYPALPAPQTTQNPLVQIPQAPTSPASGGYNPEFDFTSDASRSYRTTNYTNIYVSKTADYSHSFGITSLVIGIFSFFICWIPIIGLLVSGLGMLLGLGGLFAAALRRGSGMGFAIGGFVLSTASFVICLIWTQALGEGIREVGRLFDTMEDKHKIIDKKSWPPPAPAKKKNPQTDRAANKDNIPAPSHPQQLDWVDARQSAIQHGDLHVEVTRVYIGKIPIKALGDLTYSKDDLLAIHLKLSNMNPTKKLDYSTWSGKIISLTRDYATLRDNFGNGYSRIDFGLAAYPVASVERSESIYYNKPITDVLVFERPIDTFEYLELELPAQNVGSQGLLRFRIPKNMVQNR